MYDYLSWIWLSLLTASTFYGFYDVNRSVVNVDCGRIYQGKRLSEWICDNNSRLTELESHTGLSQIKWEEFVKDQQEKSDD